ncbi:MAG: hypothetical protein AAF518_01370 [Spirochaetota bacterium]
MMELFTNDPAYEEYSGYKEARKDFTQNDKRMTAAIKRKVLQPK